MAPKSMRLRDYHLGMVAPHKWYPVRDTSSRVLKRLTHRDIDTIGAFCRDLAEGFNYSPSPDHQSQ